MHKQWRNVQLIMRILMASNLYRRYSRAAIMRRQYIAPLKRIKHNPSEMKDKQLYIHLQLIFNIALLPCTIIIKRVRRGMQKSRWR